MVRFKRKPFYRRSPATKTLQAATNSNQLVNRDGQINISRIGAPPRWKDPYHFLLTLNWWQFIGLMLLIFVGINSLFALLYLLQPNAIANAKPGDFGDAFFFSVQTMGTIGYGVMSPQTLYAHSLVTVETFVGMLGVAIVTGLMFARFARPTARVLFSDVAIIQLYHGHPTLMFRMANQRQNQIIEAQLRASLLVDQTSPEGYFMRRFYDLPLVRSQSQFFSLTWIAMHTIDDDSPLVNLSLADLEAVNGLILVSLVGLDETFSQTVHARHVYSPQDLQWDMHFVDVLMLDEAGQRYLDYRRFHQVIPIEQR
jgi:inward rectifier potassium channel